MVECNELISKTAKAIQWCRLWIKVCTGNTLHIYNSIIIIDKILEEYKGIIGDDTGMN